MRCGRRRAVTAVPLRLKGEAHAYIEARGEVYMLKREFARLNERRTAAGEGPFARPRNSARSRISAITSASRSR